MWNRHHIYPKIVVFSVSTKTNTQGGVKLSPDKAYLITWITWRIVPVSTNCRGIHEYFVHGQPVKGHPVGRKHPSFISRAWAASHLEPPHCWSLKIDVVGMTSNQVIYTFLTRTWNVNVIITLINIYFPRNARCHIPPCRSLLPIFITLERTDFI